MKSRDLSADQFLKLLRKCASWQRIIVRDREITGKIALDFSLNHLILERINFKDQFDFLGNNEHELIEIKQCNFERGLYFNVVSLRQLNIRENSVIAIDLGIHASRCEDLELSESILEKLSITETLFDQKCNIATCTIKDWGHLDSLKINSNLKIEHCKFEKGLQFYSNEISGKLIINHSSIFGQWFIHGGSSDSIGSFDSTFDNLHFENYSLIQDSLFQKVKFLRSIVIQKLQLEGKLKFEECEMLGTVSYQSNKGTLILKAMVVKERLLLLENMKINLEIEDSELNNQVQLRGNEIEKFEIRNSRFIDTVLLSLVDESDELNSAIKELNIESAEFNRGISILGPAIQNIEKYSRSPRCINELKINASGALIGSISISNLVILESTLTGMNSKCEISFSDIFTNDFKFKNFYNNSLLNLSNILPKKNGESIFQILQSDLNNTSFFNIDFRNFKEVLIEKSNITGIKSSQIEWFDDLPIAEGNNLEIFKTRKENYRQLKFIAKREENGNDYLDFRNKEMKYLLEQMKQEKHPLNPDRFLMWTNLSNNFGLNWVRPIGLAVLLTLIFYFPLMVSLDTRLLFAPDISIRGINAFFESAGENISLFFLMFDPTRRLTIYVVPERHMVMTDLAYFLDITHRILLAYFFYQTIAAFRKYMKSS